MRRGLVLPLGSLCGLVFPRCVVCLCGCLVLASWGLWRPNVPKVCSPVALWPCFGRRGTLAALCSQGVFSVWAACVPKVCFLLAWWPGFGLLDALATLCSKGVFSPCAVALFLHIGSLGGSVFPRCVLCLCGGLVLAFWGLRRPCFPKMCSPAVLWRPCVPKVCSLLGRLVFPRCVLCMCGGFVLAS